MIAVRRTRWVAMLLAGLVALSACAGATETETSAQLDAGIEATDAESSELVPELTGQFDTIDGGQIDLGSLQGQDVVLWFWAPW